MERAAISLALGFWFFSGAWNLGFGASEVFGPLGRKEIAHRFIGGIEREKVASPEGTTEP